MHIGGSWTVGGASDSPVIRTPDGLPFIPGSSFKGAFRSTVEKLTVAAGLDSCALLKDSKCIGAQGEAQQRFNRKRRDANWTGDEYLHELDKGLCDTCNLFGSQYRASRIYFSDLLPTNSALAGGMVQVRDGVAIDRDSEKAVDRLKYDYEVVAPSLVFRLTILLDDPTDDDLALTCLGLSEFYSGLGYIGGKKSSGLGACVLRPLQIYELDLTVEDPAQRAERLRRYLLGATLADKMQETKDQAAVQAFMNDKIEKLLDRQANKKGAGDAETAS
jgi:CRISPR-associated RAMP protein (TIGR02581 family)